MGRLCRRSLLQACLLIRLLCVLPTRSAISNLSMDFLSVPIIPSFLFATYKSANHSSLQTTAMTTAALSSTAPYASGLSRDDETTVLTLDSHAHLPVVHTNETQDRNLVPHLPMTTLPPSNSCTDGVDFLSKENIRVGLLFASKATVQLLVNPFVGPLTNRYVFS